MTAEPGDAQVPWVATFFIPLPDPLNVDDGMQVAFGSPDQVPPNFVSLKIWQLKAPMVHLQQQLRHSFDVATTLAGSAQPNRGPKSQDLVLEGIATVIEAVAVLADDETEDISPAFERCLDRIAQLAVAFGLSASEAIAPVTRERLPPMIAAAVRPGDVTPTDGAGLLMFLLNTNELVRHQPSASSARQVLHFVGEQMLGGPRIAYMKLSADARRAFVRDGDLRLAAILTAASCEVLLDSLLLVLLWDEGADPAAAAAVMADGFLTTRVRKHYAARLGGRWANDGAGAVAAWHSDVAGLRNRCVHVGYSPTYDEVRAAFKADSDLLDFVKTRLRARTQRYPKASAVFGTRGQDDDERRDTIGRFVRWQDEVAAYRARDE